MLTLMLIMSLLAAKQLSGMNKVILNFMDNGGIMLPL